jgi:hypothetical protein
VEELIAQITERTGVTTEKAKEMVGVTAEWMKGKLPDDVAGQLSSLLSGAGDVAGSATSKATGVATAAAGAATGAASAATGKAGDLLNKAKDTVTGLAPGKDE